MMGKNKPTKVNANCNQVILDHFWNICDQSEEKRCRSTQVILQTLAHQVKSNANNDVSYCLDRLIRGLISTREFARHGFCVLLTQILSQFHEQSDLNDVLELAEKEYGQKVAESNSESAISWALLIGCILKSGRVTLESDAQILTRLFDYLFRLGLKKRYVEIIVCNLLSLFYDIFQDNPKKFKKMVLEKLKENDEKEIKNTIFYVYLILLALKKFPSATESRFGDFISNHIYKANSNDFAKVLSLLKETTKCHPNVHPIIQLLVETIFQIDPDNFSNLCSNIVDSIFMVNLDKTSLGFEIVRILLQFVDAQQVSDMPIDVCLLITFAF